MAQDQSQAQSHEALSNDALSSSALFSHEQVLPRRSAAARSLQPCETVSYSVDEHRWCTRCQSHHLHLDAVEEHETVAVLELEDDEAQVAMRCGSWTDWMEMLLSRGFIDRRLFVGGDGPEAELDEESRIYVLEL